VPAAAAPGTPAKGGAGAAPTARQAPPARSPLGCLPQNDADVGAARAAAAPSPGAAGSPGAGREAADAVARASPGAQPGPKAARLGASGGQQRPAGVRKPASPRAKEAQAHARRAQARPRAAAQLLLRAQRGGGTGALRGRKLLAEAPGADAGRAAQGLRALT